MSLTKTFDIHYYYRYHYYCTYCTSFNVGIRMFLIIWVNANQSEPKKRKNHIFVKKCRYYYFSIRFKILPKLQKLSCRKVKQN